ncbi:MAG: STAS domain-containing protein [Acidobacteriota bacterium]
MSDLNLSTRENGDVVIVDLNGRIGLGETSSELHQKLKDLAAAGKNKVILNLANVTGIDSSGLGSLIAGYATIEKNGGALKLLSLSDRVTELMNITKLLTVFDIFDDEETAVASYGASAAA